MSQVTTAGAIGPAAESQDLYLARAKLTEGLGRLELIIIKHRREAQEGCSEATSKGTIGRRHRGPRD
jgi:hypothetical protein